ncbi:MAG: polyphosphate polymerase domain-containing protein [Lachnospiraceae bacterium]|nr:polyphosphate polymerase domain-containing protein [Lachnospiraceae bacterium]
MSPEVSDNRNYRHEYKYIVSAAQEKLLSMKARALLMRDAHADADGCYRIASLYFDDAADRCYHEKEDGEALRAKYRIRRYGDDRSLLRLEKKGKNGDLTWKESCVISEEQCREMMRGRIPEHERESQVRLLEEMRLLSLLPRVIVAYEREPWIYPAGNVRITFDRSITSSVDVDGFLDDTCLKRPILRQGMSIMEIKWDDLLPAHIRRGMQTADLSRSAFSKYCYARKFSPGGELR